MNIFFLTLFLITTSPYAGANTIFNEEMSFLMAKAVKLGRGNGASGWEKAKIATGKRAVDTGKACMAHCAACDTKTGQCSKCKDGYWIEGGSCNLCSDFLENCALCDSSGSTCTKCFDGYKLSAGSCMGGSCADGYWWDDTELACFSCPSTCKTCSDDATCESCFDGYYHDMDQCVACPKNCKQCDYDGCTQCQTGYELKNGKCTQITCEIADCNICSEDGKSCLQCKNGWEWFTNMSPLPDGCYPDDPNCKTYDDFTGKECIECNAGYLLNSTNLCVECLQVDDRTRNCNGTIRCLYSSDKIIDGLYCGIPHCKSYNVTNPEKCSICAPGYMGEKCQNCASGYGKTTNEECEKYPADLSCETYTYTTDGFECNSCSSPEKLACDSVTKRKVCVEDYDHRFTQCPNN